jgi:hypothetical protein
VLYFSHVEFCLQRDFLCLRIAGIQRTCKTEFRNRYFFCTTRQIDNAVCVIINIQYLRFADNNDLLFVVFGILALVNTAGEIL